MHSIETLVSNYCIRFNQGHQQLGIDFYLKHSTNYKKKKNFYSKLVYFLLKQVL